MWTLQNIRDRYWKYCKAMGIDPGPCDDFCPDSYTVDRGWICSIIEALIVRMKRADLAAAEIGIELMEESGGFFFGRCLKANAARALGKCQLTNNQKNRIRSRVMSMLENNFLPKEFRSYAWLARRIGMADFGARLAKVDRSLPWPAWYADYLAMANPPRPPRTSRGDYPGSLVGKKFCEGW